MKVKVGLLLSLLAIFVLIILGISSVATAGPKLTGIEATDPSGTGPLVHYVSERVPVRGESIERGAMRPMVPTSSSDAAPARVEATNPVSNSWQLLGSMPGATVKDISFPTPLIGYAAAELGQVWKTTDGGVHWTRIMNLGFPYYWYGVHALDANTVAITGFNNQTGEGVLRWSTDGGVVWGSDQLLNPNGWTFRVRFADALHGLAIEGTEPEKAHYTTDGGATASDWISVTIDHNPQSGWFGSQFSLLPDLKADTSGITYCDSANGGANWNCGPSVDSVFDGATFFVNDQAGWVGGGSISPTIEGWVHRTTDGGATWSGRTVTTPWPVREIRFLTDQIGWAVGGNLYSNVGGMYFTTDGGQTWGLDLETGIEMTSCDTQPLNGGQQIWCVGFTSSPGWSSSVYGLNYGGATTPTATATPVTTPSSTSTVVPTDTPTSTATDTATSIPSTPTPLITATPCAIQFTDVPAGSTFYANIHCLACLGIINGYPCGGPGEPCSPNNDPYFRPSNSVSRGQLSKIISNSAGFSDAQPDQLFEDVPLGSTFQDFIGRLATRGYISGYPCGGVGEPCGPNNLPYFRPNNQASRGQISKIDANAANYLDDPTGQQFEDVQVGSTYYTYTYRLVLHNVMSGYPCGGVGEPCGPTNLPYFRPNANATRGQTSKIVGNTFFPLCSIPTGR